jgi:hypothetical protein
MQNRHMKKVALPRNIYIKKKKKKTYSIIPPYSGQ